MTFSFQKYGTFAGPGTEYKYRDNDEFANIFEDPTFNLSDVSMVLLNNSSDYVYLHLSGTSTSSVTLEKNTGIISTFSVNALSTVFSNNVNILGSLSVSGSISGPTISSLSSGISAAQSTANSKKGFDIFHPTKENHRLRYICVEGPAAEVYLRGKLKDNNTIELPDYWKELVDLDTIGITLTPIGSYQELFVEKIEDAKKIIIKNNLNNQINCSFVVFAERKDVEKNIPEYEGLAPIDYPGDNEQYNINGFPGRNWLNMRHD